MPPPDEYSVGGGKLKLKGAKVSEGRVEKKKSKKKNKSKEVEQQQQQQGEENELEVMKTGDHQNHQKEREGGGQGEELGEGGNITSTTESSGSTGKTQAEMKYEQARRKRVSGYNFDSVRFDSIQFNSFQSPIYCLFYKANC